MRSSGETRLSPFRRRSYPISISWIASGPNRQMEKSARASAGHAGAFHQTAKGQNLEGSRQNGCERRGRAAFLSGTAKSISISRQVSNPSPTEPPPGGQKGAGGVFKLLKAVSGYPWKCRLAVRYVLPRQTDSFPEMAPLSPCRKVPGGSRGRGGGMTPAPGSMESGRGPLAVEP